MKPDSQKSEELRLIFKSVSGYFGWAILFSLAINLLYLASPLYMLQVYDRVVNSSSIVTLVMLTLALLFAFAVLASLDVVRARVLTRATIRLDRLMAARVMSAIIERATAQASKSQLLRDFDNFRQFVTGSGIHALFDLPWAPIYIAVIFMLHPLLGGFALGSALVLIILAVFNESFVRRPLTASGEAASRHYGFTEMSLRNTEVVRAMGMTGGLLRRWARDRNRMLERQVAASDRAAALASIIKFMRLSMQSVILGLGAYLVIERSVTVGAMFAASLLLGRAIQPVEQVVGSWRNLVSARGAFVRVRELLMATPVPAQRLALPRPSGRITVENVTAIAPGLAKPILRGIAFEIQPGEVLGLIGHSGSGKSTLARHMVGVLTAHSGVVRLDGANVAHWPREAFGEHIGYLPQDVELFADTVAMNISRFLKGNDAAVIAAAELAGVHDLVLRLPDGYDTQIGEGGAVLSGGFRQRIGLARAVYGNPSAVVLDEPNSNLDAAGDAALTDCILKLKKRGTTVVIISHRPSALNAVDKVAVMNDGALELFGPRAEVINRLTRAVPVQTAAAAS